MRVLLDVDIIIDKEINILPSEDTVTLYDWLQRCHCIPCIHLTSYLDITKSFKLSKDIITNLTTKYEILEISSQISPLIEDISQKYDKNIPDIQDSILLNELIVGHVDVLVSEHPNLHYKAQLIGMDGAVFDIDSFLEKLDVEYPGFIDYKGLNVRKTTFENVDVNDPFFDGLKEDYSDFSGWFRRKRDEEVYITYDKNGHQILSFLYLKIEFEDEDYSDISPVFEKKKRLKIGTFKVTSNGFRLGERFMKIVFDHALRNHVQEIYVTLYNKRIEQHRLVNLLGIWGFRFWGKKGEELVYVRDFSPSFNLDAINCCYPYISINSNNYLVPIYQRYHKETFPESNIIMNQNNPTEEKPHRNGITKVYITRDLNAQLKHGDNMFFYRTGGTDKGVLSTLGVVLEVKKHFINEALFISFCRKNAPQSNDKLTRMWNRKKEKPMAVKFLYNYSFPERVPMTELIKQGIVLENNTNIIPISQEQVKHIFEITKSDESIIVY